MKKFTKRILVTALLAGSVVTTAQAETASVSVDVFAGLASVMELTCTNVNFGLWRVPTGARTGGASTITLTDLSATSVTAGSSASIALSTAKAAPAAGSCSVSGSTKITGNGTAALTGATGSFATNGGTGFNNETLAAATTPVSAFTYALALSSATPAISSTGTSAFTIAGTMSIPDGLAVANYGGYKGAAITVAFTD